MTEAIDWSGDAFAHRCSRWLRTQGWESAWTLVPVDGQPRRAKMEFAWSARHGRMVLKVCPEGEQWSKAPEWVVESPDLVGGDAPESALLEAIGKLRKQVAEHWRRQ